MAEFRLLGPLEVLENGTPLPLGSGRQRALLALLLLHRNTVVSVDRIADELWGAEPPPTAAKIVQVYVSGLRKALGEERIATARPGYRLSIEPGELDVERVETLLANARESEPRRKAALLREALALWRGEPLADVAYDGFAQTEIARLEELRLSVLEERIEADIALGRHVDVVGELEALVAHHPLREHLRALLMRALYRAGRQADALECYQTGRRLLRDELGLNPGRELQETERAILMQDAALEAPRRVSPVLASRRRGQLALIVGASVIVAGSLAAFLLRGSDDDDASVTVKANSVAVIDPRTNEIVASVPVGTGPSRIVAGAGAVWVLNGGDLTLSRIDPKTKATTTVATGTRPSDFTIGAGSLWLVTPCPGSGLFRLDPDSRTVERIVKLPWKCVGGDGPSYVAYGYGDVWVASEEDSVVWRIDSRRNAVEAKIPFRAVGGSFSGEGVEVGEGAVWVNRKDAIVRVDPRSNTATTIDVRQWFGGMAVGGGAIWVADNETGLLWRVDPGREVAVQSIKVGDAPLGVAFGAGSVWVANSGSGTISRIDPRTGDVTRTIEIGASASDVVVGGGAVWASVG